jgi:membrane protein implicated in regulation of membrane protease activity
MNLSGSWLHEPVDRTGDASHYRWAYRLTGTERTVFAAHECGNVDIRGAFWTHSEDSRQPTSTRVSAAAWQPAAAMVNAWNTSW